MYGEAIKAYQQSLRDNPKDDETRYNLALCKQQNKQNQQQNQQNKDQNKDKNQDKQKQDKKHRKADLVSD